MKIKNFGYRSRKRTPRGRIYFCCDNVGAPHSTKHGVVHHLWQSTERYWLPRWKHSLRDHRG